MSGDAVGVPLGLFLHLAVLAVVSYRVTRFIVSDTLIEGWRDRFKGWVWVDPDTMRTLRKVTGHPWLTFLRGKLGELLTCPFCVSVHVAFWTYLIVQIDGGQDDASLVEHGVAWLAIAGGTVMIWNKVEIDVDHEED